MKNISDSYVTAPISGFVVKKFVEAGESVTQLSSLLMLSDLDYVDLVIYVSETELGKVKLGQAAKVTVDSYKNRTFTGKVIFISPDAEFTPKNIQTNDERTKLVYAVKIHLHNPDYALKDGMPADAVVDLQ
jgi:HlyD family secretion protein